jgi:hypothetical protein
MPCWMWWPSRFWLRLRCPISETASGLIAPKARICMDGGLFCERLPVDLSGRSLQVIKLSKHQSPITLSKRYSSRH